MPGGYRFFTLTANKGGLVPPLGVTLACASALTVFFYQVDVGPWVASTEGLEAGEWWRLATSWLAHRDIWHVLSNVWGIGIFGWPLERDAGRWRFAFVFVGGVVAGNFIQIFLMSGPVEIWGASGGVFALAGVWLSWALRRTFTPRGGTVLGLLILFLAGSVAAQLAWSGYAWWAHGVGLVWGMVCQVFLPKPTPKYPVPEEEPVEY